MKIPNTISCNEKMSPSELLEMVKQVTDAASALRFGFEDRSWPDLSDISRNDRISIDSGIKDAAGMLKELDGMLPDEITEATMEEPDDLVEGGAGK